MTAITITISDVTNGWRFDVFENGRYVRSENIERKIDVLKALDSWTTGEISKELKSIKGSPSWEVI